MPTPDAEIDAAARRVFERLGWWKPGQMREEWCYTCAQPHPDGEVEVPPPDWRDPAVFLRLLMESKTYALGFDESSQRWICELRPMWDFQADDPRAALILALAAMLEVE